jgi:hypothetical protein
MRWLIVLALLGGCSATDAERHAKVIEVLRIACMVDGIVVPIAQPVVTLLGPTGATAASIDLFVHPAVVAACRALDGTPVIPPPTQAVATQ